MLLHHSVKVLGTPPAYLIDFAFFLSFESQPDRSSISRKYFYRHLNKMKVFTQKPETMMTLA